MKDVLAFVLAGGQGSRLNALCAHRAKPAVPFGGNYRIIDFVLSSLMHSRIEHVGVLTQYRPRSLMDHINDGYTWDFSGRRRCIKILPPYQAEKDSDWYAGTADAIRQNIDFVTTYNPKYILIVSADHIYSMDFTDLVKKHIESKAALTIVSKEVPWSEVSRYGIMSVDENQKVTDFVEKPKESKSNLASLGIYVFNADILIDMLNIDKYNTTSSHDFGKDIIPSMIKQDNVYTYKFDGYWMDVGTLSSYMEANMDLVRPLPQINLYGWDIKSPIKDLPPAKFRENTRIRNSIICNGCIIGGIVENSILAPNVVIHHGAQITNSIIFENTIIGENSVIDNAIIDKDVKVGENCHIGIGSPDTVNKKYPDHLNCGITLIAKEANIPSNCQIGKNVLIETQVSENDFKEKVIFSGETIEKKDDNE